MKIKRLSIFIAPLIVMTFLSSCKQDANFSNKEWFISGYGSFVNGRINSSLGGIKLNKLDKPHEGYSESFGVTDLDLKVGDSLYILSKNDTVRLKNYNSEIGSFTTKNVSLYEENNKVCVDILKTGKYNFTLDVNSSNTMLSITNGTGTTDNLNPVIPANETISIFENGDYHAAIHEKSNQVGLLKYATFVKQSMLETEEDDILISNGDLWEGNYESNANYGQMLNHVIKELNYEAFNLGNHEFDWGIDNIRERQQEVKIPYLGANIVNYKTKELVDFVQPFTIVERGDVKVGIIGVIGVSQWTSILSTYVDDIEFTDVETCAKKYSDRLKTEFGCHVVVLMNHDGTDASILSPYYELCKTSPISGATYCDAFIFGHDHISAKGYIDSSTNKGPFVNSGSNGAALGHINLDIKNGKVVNSFSELLHPSSDLSEDIPTKIVYDTYCDVYVKAKAKEVVGRASASFTKYATAGNLMCKAIYDYLFAKGIDVDIVIVNGARAYINAGDVTYSLITDAFPFFNHIIVMSTSGADIKSVGRNNNVFMPRIVNFNSSSNYTIATYDYLAFHKSTSRTYDKFHSFSVKNTFTDYPSDILAEYWKQFTTALNPSNYNDYHYSL